MINTIKEFLNIKPADLIKRKSVKLKSGLVVEHFYNYETGITQIIVKKLHRVNHI
jgi:hypothetical protein